MQQLLSIEYNSYGSHGFPLPRKKFDKFKSLGKFFIHHVEACSNGGGSNNGNHRGAKFTSK